MERPQKRKVDWWTMGPVVGFMAICAAAAADSKGYTPGDIDLKAFFRTEEEPEEVCRFKVEGPTDLGRIAAQCMPGATEEERQDTVEDVATWQTGGSLTVEPGDVPDDILELPRVEVTVTTTTEPA